MTPNEAALCLRDDPTFATSPLAEQREEAILLLGHDDALDVGLAIELALTPLPPRETVVAAKSGIEPCRLTGNGCGGKEPVAGNGRCMTCGAYRVPQSFAEPVEDDDEPIRTRYKAPAAAGGDIVRRFKTVTGMTNPEIAKLLGRSRQTVAFYVSGDMVEQLSGEQLEALHDTLTLRAQECGLLAKELRETLDSA